MSKPKSVTFKRSSVTFKRDTLARARPSFGGDVTVSRCHDRRDVTTGARDSDTDPCGDPHHHHEATPSTVTKPMTWMHVAALNTIADHEAGRSVDPMRLDAARRLLGRSAA